MSQTLEQSLYIFGRERFTFGILRGIEIFFPDVSKEQKRSLFRQALEKDMAPQEIDYWGQWHSLV